MSTLFKTAAIVLIGVTAAGASAQITFTNEAKTFTAKLGGRVNNDWSVISADNPLVAAVGDFEDGNEFRRARLGISGEVWESVFFKAEYDFEGGSSDFKDVYMGIKTGAGKLQVGHFKEPFSLEQLQSSNDITFIERSNHDSFSPARNTGFQLSNTAGEGRLYWAVGMFRDTDNFGDSAGDGEYNFTGRVAGTPMYQDDGKSLLHVGASVSVRSPNDNTVRARDNREVHLAPRIADTGSIGTDGVILTNIEVAWANGPLSVQAESAMAMVSATTGSDPDFMATYVQVAYVLTGESRSYKQANAVFGTVKPAENFGTKTGGVGAWELALRYSMLDLSDAGITGGEVDSVSFGVNWYLNPNARVMVNLVQSDLDGVGDYQAATARFQLNF